MRHATIIRGFGLLMVALAAAAASIDCGGHGGTATTASPTSRPTASPVALRPTVPAGLARNIPVIDFEAVPLSDAVEFVRIVSDATIDVRWEVLEKAGVDKDTPVTMHLRNVRVEQALKVILADLSPATRVAYAAGRDAVVISTRDDLESRPETRMHDIGRLIAKAPGSHERASRVMLVLKEVVAREAWQPLGDSKMTQADGKLEATCSAGAHDELATAIALLADGPAPTRRPAPAKATTTPAEALALILPQVHTTDVPLADALAYLRDAAGVNLDIRWNRLAAAGISRDTPVSLNLKNATASDVIKAMLKAAKADANVGMQAADGCVVISSVDDLLAATELRVYDVGKLLAAGKGTADERAEALMKSLQAKARPDVVWAQGGFGGMACLDGKLLVRCAPMVHAEIDAAFNQGMAKP